MKYVRQLRIPANVTNEDLIYIKKNQDHCNIQEKCMIINSCLYCILSPRNKVYFDHWFLNQYKGERLKKGKMSIKLEGKKLYGK